MVPKTNESIEALITCSMCQDIFQHPRMLTCQHTFCEDCLASYIERKRGNETLKHIKCPVCKEIVNFKKNIGSVQFKRNITMERLLTTQSAVDTAESYMKKALTGRNAGKGIQTEPDWLCLPEVKPFSEMDEATRLLGQRKGSMNVEWLERILIRYIGFIGYGCKTYDFDFTSKESVYAAGLWTVITMCCLFILGITTSAVTLPNTLIFLWFAYRLCLHTLTLRWTVGQNKKRYHVNFLSSVVLTSLFNVAWTVVHVFMLMVLSEIYSVFTGDRLLGFPSL